MKIFATVSGVLLLAVITLSWLYVGQSEDLALAEDKNSDLARAYEELQAREKITQQKIIERDQERAKLRRINRGLKHALDSRIKMDPDARQWRDVVIPGAYVDFVRDARDSAARMSGAAGQSDSADTDSGG